MFFKDNDCHYIKSLILEISHKIQQTTIRKTSNMQQHLYIHGGYIKSDSNDLFETINPATNQVICMVDQASEDDVEKAVISAEQGFAVWSAMSAIERSRILLKAVAILRERNNELAALEVMDTGNV
jgi:betaine-aldehyde dehydrogenase